MKALSIPEVKDFSHFMARRNKIQRISPNIHTTIKEYVQHQDAVLLHKLIKKSAYEFYYYVDDITGKVVLLLCKSKTHLPIMLNLSVNPNNEIVFGNYTKYSKALLHKFIKSRYSLFIPRRKQQ